MQEGIGRVIKSTGSWYHVRNEKGEVLEARIPGKFRLRGIQHTNPIAAGDWVQFKKDAAGNVTITEIQERKNYLIRRSVNLSKRSHIIAANVDVMFLMVTLCQPKTSMGFMDRVLVTCEAYHIPVFILFNKVDIYSESELELLEEYEDLYAQVGYDSLRIVAHEAQGDEELRALFAQKTSMIAGHSGVGKTTLVNALNPNLDLRTKTISGFNAKGQHTTTHAEMHELFPNAYLIDTPGIKEFGLVDISVEELQGYFPEIQYHKRNCKFHNCKHINEPKCAVLNAVDNAEMAASRYLNYRLFVEELEQEGMDN